MKKGLCQFNWQGEIMFRMFSTVLVLLVAVVGCRSSSTIIEDSRNEKLQVYRWSGVDSMEEFTTGHREVVVNGHLDTTLGKVVNAEKPEDLAFAHQKLEIVKAAQRPVVVVEGTVINYLNLPVDVEVYILGGDKPFARLPLAASWHPEGTREVFHLTEGRRYVFCFFEQGTDQKVGMYTLKNPAHKGWIAGIRSDAKG